MSTSRDAKRIRDPPGIFSARAGPVPPLEETGNYTVQPCARGCTFQLSRSRRTPERRKFITRLAHLPSVEKLTC
ncbi:hypothetical protein WN51_02411 [Melipona quadrifasciata]|uniref:Uncharacterized protein n=1 Tax=Melipona quadrifasciata TaxID=166423 RepID=A0A0M8ZUQ9_9HYME|nr:hypothetical protein WN51_02411 [Melipona quadrifasciata]